MAAAASPARAAGAAPSAASAAIASVQENVVPKISCVTATDCLGIKGSSPLNGGNLRVPATIARWNGSGWRRAHLRLPAGTRSADLYAVSCRAAKSCLVVGDYYTGKTESAPSHALALVYNGTSLKPMPPMPRPKSRNWVTLRGVSCTTTRHCVAVGMASGDPSELGGPSQVSLIETWNGTKWTLHTAAAPTGTEVTLSGVSCVTAAFCLLTGEISTANNTKLFLDSWNGRKLTVMKPAPVGGGASFQLASDVSCGTRASCMVTGAVLSAGGNSIDALTEVWNGKAWRTVTVPLRPGAAGSTLVGVTCLSARSCEAVGLAGSESAPGTSAASYNGTAWALQPVPAPVKGRETALSGVSCLSAARCVAIGETGKASGIATSIVTGVWNGTTWRLGPGF